MKENILYDNNGIIITINVVDIVNIGLYQAKKEKSIKYILKQIGGDIVDYTVCCIAKHLEGNEKEAIDFIKEDINNQSFLYWLFCFVFFEQGRITLSTKIFEEYFIPQIKEAFKC